MTSTIVRRLLSNDSFRRANHYVPRSYLKRWTGEDGKLSSYRVLVSHAGVPLWKRVSPGGIAYHEHLYTKAAAFGESDALERWLDSEFEAPAEDVIDKVVNDRRLSPTDWRVLARFLAAQDVRTPARFGENMRRWSATLPQMIESTLAESVARLEAMSDSERAELPKGKSPENDIPFRVRIEAKQGAEGGLLKGETIAGRGLWIWSIRHLLTRTLTVLLGHRWTILTPPDGLTWFTSDDPVLRVNFNSLTDYTFGGGWGSAGTDLLLPLGPRHLLFTQVDRPVPPRGKQMDAQKAKIVCKLIADHAHRHIFSSAPDPAVERLRPRSVDADLLARESLEWHHFHRDQTAAERDLMEWDSGSSRVNSRDDG